MPVRNLILTALTIFSLSVLTACGKSEADQPPDGAAASVEPASEVTASTPYVVEVLGLDYAFSAPREIPSGWTTFRFTNRGTEPHHMVLVRLEEGHTVTELREELKNFKPLPGWITELGGPNAANPGGGVSNATLHLEPGNYALLCMIPSPNDHVQHFMKGMVWPLTVTEETTGAPAPEVDIEMALSDYAFETTPAITAGEHTIRVSNHATTQSHEVELVRLAPGKKVEDVVRWVHKPEGPPPASFIGGVSDLSPSESGIFTARFEPGEYAWICFIPDHKDGKPHFMHGMMQQFTVEASS